ncbi:MAG: regulatory protein RecX [Candidatus Symbiopectobacterium sp. Dall1.0]|nr:regulatory protein RecX [Candidatus Symbiopectobacterium sp. Dall1.0]
MSEKELYDYAITLLAKKDYSSGSLRRLLSKLTEKEEDVDRVVRRLSDNHYLNDTQLINNLIDKHIKKLHGPTRIKQEIRQKGFPQELIEQKIESSGIDWYSMAKEARIRKFSETPPTEQKEKAKQIRYLQYKGFSMDMIFEAFS